LLRSKCDFQDEMVEVKGDCKIGSKAGYESFGGAKTRKGLKNFQLKGDGIEGVIVLINWR
jgi:hypothetical protein